MVPHTLIWQPTPGPPSAPPLTGPAQPVELPVPLEAEEAVAVAEVEPALEPTAVAELPVELGAAVDVLELARPDEALDARALIAVLPAIELPVAVDDVAKEVEGPAAVPMAGPDELRAALELDDDWLDAVPPTAAPETPAAVGVEPAPAVVPEDSFFGDGLR